MPIDFDDRSVDVGGVDDRRGMPGGGGLAIGGGASIVGVLFYVLFQVLSGGGGGGGLALPQAGAGAPGQVAGESREELAQRCNSDGALQRYTDCRLIKVFTIADDVWSAEFDRRGWAYSSPRFVFFTTSTSTGCGAASAEVGPFYCPADREIYFELGFLEELQRQFGAQGEFAQAYIVAHEFGHHLQTLMGTEAAVRAAQRRDPGSANELSVGMELQADCYAGVWSLLADRSEGNGIGLTEADVAEAVRAAGAVGDDRIQKKMSGRVDPESWTHGSAEQRTQWYQTGFRSGSVEQCTSVRTG